MVISGIGSGRVSGLSLIHIYLRPSIGGEGMNLAKGSELGGGILLADQHGVGFLGLRVHQVIEDGVAADMGRKHHLLYEK